jgi:hypothetical protein
VRERLGLGRRLDHLEDKLGGKGRCGCIVVRSPDEFPADYVFPDMDRAMFGRVVYEPCPDCGVDLERLVYVTYWLG